MFRFPWGDFHSLNLGWFLQKFNELREDWATAEAGIDGALDAEIQKAEDALTDVFAARDAAAASASAANSSALNASQSSLASMDARDQSRAARDAAQQAARNAAASETAAGSSATAASNSAGAAATSATQAGQSATAAGNSATAAGQSATNAAASETAAGNSAAAAAASETAAGNSATDAAASKSAAEAAALSIVPFPLAMPLRQILNADFTTPASQGRYIVEKYEHLTLLKTFTSTGSQKISLKNGIGSYQALGATTLTEITAEDFWQLPASLKNDQLKLNLIFIPDTNTKPYQLVLYSCWANIEDETINVIHTTRTQIALSVASSKAVYATQIIKDIPMYEDADYLALYIGTGGSERTGEIFLFLNTPTNTALTLSN